MRGVRLEARLREERSPAVVLRSVGVAVRARGDVDRAEVGRVALEVQRVDDRALDRALRRETDDDPVGARTAPALRLPAITHVHAAAGHDQVVARAEEHVVAGDDETAVLRRREVDELRAVAPAHPARARHDVAVHAETRDAAVRVDVEAQMGEPLRDVDLEAVLRIAGELGPREDLGPLHVAREERRDVGVPLDARAFDRARLRVVALEVRGVDDEAAHHAGETEADDARVVVGVRARGLGVLPLAPRLPAVHPLAAVGEFSGDEDRLLRLEEILLLREEVVSAPEHEAAEALRCEIDELVEIRHVDPGRLQQASSAVRDDHAVAACPARARRERRRISLPRSRDCGPRASLDRARRPPRG